MSERLEKLLKELLAEQKLTSFFTLTLEANRLLTALLEAGYGVPVVTANEFTVAPGASQTIVQVVPSGSVYVMGGGVTIEWWTSLPWWCSWFTWWDQTPPATPILAVNRMPSDMTMPQFSGLAAIRGFLMSTVTNLHVSDSAYCLVTNYFLQVDVATWEMIKAVYIDPIVSEVRKRGLEKSGLLRG